MANNMNFLQKTISRLAKVELTVLHGLWQVAGFFMVLPLLGSETSGSPKNIFERVWEKGFKAAEAGFGRLQVGQVRLLRRLGSLESGFAGEMVKEYAHTFLVSKKTAPYPYDRVSYLIKLNKEGTLSDTDTAVFLEEATRSCYLRAEFNPETKTFYTIHQVSDEQFQNQERTRDAMLNWVEKKLPSLKNMGRGQGDFAVALAGICKGTPMAATGAENDIIALSGRTSDNYLCAVFKEAVQTNGEPLAIFNGQAMSTSDMLASFEKSYKQQQAVFAQRRQDIEGWKTKDSDMTDWEIELANNERYAAEDTEILTGFLRKYVKSPLPGPS